MHQYCRSEASPELGNVPRAGLANLRSCSSVYCLSCGFSLLFFGFESYSYLVFIVCMFFCFSHVIWQLHNLSHECAACRTLSARGKGRHPGHDSIERHSHLYIERGYRQRRLPSLLRTHASHANRDPLIPPSFPPPPNPSPTNANVAGPPGSSAGERPRAHG